MLFRMVVRFVKRAAEPALVHVELSARLRRFLDGLLRLLLAADEKDFAAARRDLAEERAWPLSSCSTVLPRLMM